MKQFLKLVLTLAALALCTATFAARDSKRQLRGSGNIITKEITISNDYTAILATTCVNVVMADKEGSQATIVADDNVMEWVVCEAVGDVLNVKVEKPNCNSYSDINVTVTIPRNDKLQRVECRASAEVHILPTLKSEKKLFLRASSSSKIVVNRTENPEVGIHATSSSSVHGAFQTSFCAMNANSSADIKASVLAEKISLWASSSATIKLSGAATTLSGEVTSSGDILCSELATVNAMVEASSSGKATLNCNGKLIARASSAADIISTNSSAESATADSSSGADIKLKCHGTLTATATSGGDVKYTGDCHIKHIKTSSGGSIKKF